MTTILEVQSFDLTAADTISDIAEYLERVKLIHDEIDTRFFNRINHQEQSVQTGIIYEYHKYSVFSNIVSDNITQLEQKVNQLSQALYNYLESERGL